MAKICHMEEAIALAEDAKRAGEVPVGVVIMQEKQGVIATAHNLVEKEQNPLRHAEMIAIENARKSLKFRQKYLLDCDIYVTLEPCAMCMHAIRLCRFRRVYWGAESPGKAGFSPEIYEGIKEGECASLLQSFFEKKR